MHYSRAEFFLMAILESKQITKSTSLPKNLIKLTKWYIFVSRISQTCSLIKRRYREPCWDILQPHNCISLSLLAVNCMKIKSLIHNHITCILKKIHILILPLYFMQHDFITQYFDPTSLICYF